MGNLRAPNEKSNHQGLDESISEFNIGFHKQCIQ
jgi:hypothetical protein